jgi:hypothetical protein
MIQFHPAAANISAVAFPNPELAPVITIIFSIKRIGSRKSKVSVWLYAGVYKLSNEHYGSLSKNSDSFIIYPFSLVNIGAGSLCFSFEHAIPSRTNRRCTKNGFSQTIENGEIL